MADTASHRRRSITRTVKRIPAAYERVPLRGSGHVRNLRKDGLFVEVEVLPVPGDQVHVVFETRDGDKIELSGTVRWTTADRPTEADGKPGFGMQIEDVTQEYLAFLEDLLLR